MMDEEYPNAGFLRRLFEALKFRIWLKLPIDKNGKTNKDSIEEIPNY
jgi:hypothetical protein